MSRDRWDAGSESCARHWGGSCTSWRAGKWRDGGRNVGGKRWVRVAHDFTDTWRDVDLI